MSDDTTWFWEIVDANGLNNVSSDERQALRGLVAQAARAETATRQRDEALAALKAARGLLDLYREAVRIDVKMEGPLYMGANSSALKRAWEADRATPSDPGTEQREAGRG